MHDLVKFEWVFEHYYGLQTEFFVFEQETTDEKNPLINKIFCTKLSLQKR